MTFVLLFKTSPLRDPSRTLLTLALGVSSVFGMKRRPERAIRRRGVRCGSVARHGSFWLVITPRPPRGSGLLKPCPKTPLTPDSPPLTDAVPGFMSAPSW